MNSFDISEIMGVRHHNFIRTIRKNAPDAFSSWIKTKDGKLHLVYELTRREMFLTLTNGKGAPFADLILPNQEIYDYAYKNCDDRLKGEISHFRRDARMFVFRPFEIVGSEKVAETMGIKHHNMLYTIRKNLPNATSYVRKTKGGQLHPHYIFRTRRELFTLLTGRKGAKFANILLPSPEIYKYAVSPIRHRIFELNEQRKTQLWQNRNHNLDIDVENTKQELKKLEELLNEALSI